MSQQEKKILITEGEQIKIALKNNENICIRITCRNDQLFIEDISLKELEEMQSEEEQVKQMKKYLKNRKENE